MAKSTGTELQGAAQPAKAAKAATAKAAKPVRAKPAKKTTTPAVDHTMDDINTSVAMSNEFAIGYPSKFPRMVTAGDSYDVLAARMKNKLPADAWPRLVKALKRDCGLKITDRADELWP